MPGMSGIALLSEVKQRFPWVMRMLVTGYADMHTAIEAINKGKVYHFLLKPWNVDELKETIAYALESLKLKRENELLLQEKNDWQLRQASLEKSNLQARFESLKNQLNPHFLFNNFNIIASLIAIDPQEAVVFTQRFAKLFRQLLTLHELPLITLQEELDFVEEWLQLQQVRFGHNLGYTLHGHAAPGQWSLPPLALHTLVENAVKHNEISSANPLHITIGFAAGEAWVSNPLQLRKGGPDGSTGLGLKNLEARYGLLGKPLQQPPPKAGVFCIYVPLFPHLSSTV
ncbi:MAG: response regulator [Bacteroidetes bacterium]|nr:MAG: response regulator [Bacteroidota bacterium]